MTNCEGQRFYTAQSQFNEYATDYAAKMLRPRIILALRKNTIEERLNDPAIILAKETALEVVKILSKVIISRNPKWQGGIGEQAFTSASSCGMVLAALSILPRHEYLLDLAENVCAKSLLAISKESQYANWTLTILMNAINKGKVNLSMRGAYPSSTLY